MLKHSKGPWEAVYDESDEKWYVVSSGLDDGFGEYRVAEEISQPLAGDGEADAKLIALSPELLEYVASSASAGCATAQALIAKLR